MVFQREGELAGGVGGDALVEVAGEYLVTAVCQGGARGGASVEEVYVGSGVAVGGIEGVDDTVVGILGRQEFDGGGVLVGRDAAHGDFVHHDVLARLVGDGELYLGEQAVEGEADGDVAVHFKLLLVGHGDAVKGGSSGYVVGGMYLEVVEMGGVV